MPEKEPDVHNKINEFLSAMLSVGDIYFVDKDNYVRRKAKMDEPIVLKIGNMNRRLMMYAMGIKDPESVIINPFSEGISDNVERNWFYDRLNDGLNLVLDRVIMFIIRAAIVLKTETPTNEQTEMKEDVDLARLIAPFLDIVDDKLPDEFRQIYVTDKSRLFGIVYQKREKHAFFRCSVFDDTLRKALPRVRKKSWTALEKIILTIFGCANYEALQKIYYAEATTPNCPMFESYSKVWFMVLKAFGEYLPYIDEKLEFDKLEEHICNIQLYHSKARWLSQATAVQTSPAATSPASPVQGGGCSGMVRPSAPGTVNYPWRQQQQQAAPVAHVRQGGYVFQQGGGYVGGGSPYAQPQNPYVGSVPVSPYGGNNPYGSGGTVGYGQSHQYVWQR